MKKLLKKLFSGVLSAALLLFTMPLALAANDLEGSWARPYIEYLGQIPYNGETGGVIRPNSTTGNYDPDKQVTRAEFMRYINRAFNFTEKASISQYTDLSANGWYIETIQIAAKHGYISGTNAVSMSPSAPITREQVISVLGRLFKKNLVEVAPETLKFTDNKMIGKWSAAYVKDAVDAGIVRGYTDGSFKPAATVTRAEVASLLYHYMGSSLNTAGTVYTAASIKPDTQNVTISAPCTLQNAVIEGDLYITEGVSGTVNLTNVTIKGDLIQSGGTLRCNGVTAGSMVVDSPMGRLTEATASGAVEIPAVYVRSAASISERDLTGTGFAAIVLEGEAPSLTLDGTANVTAASKSTITTTASAVVEMLTANAPVTVTGYGSIRSALLNAADCSLAMMPLSGYSVKEGLTASIAGQEVSGSQSIPTPLPPVNSAAANAAPVNGVSLTAVTYDRNPASEAHEDIVVSLFSVDDAVFRSVVLGGVELESTFTRSTITIDANELAEVYPGTYTLTYIMNKGENPTLKLTIIDTGAESSPYDLDTEWNGDWEEDVEFRSPKNQDYTERTSVSSIKYNGNNLSSQAISWEPGSSRLRITIDGEEIDKWFSDYNDPDYLDFDVKLTEPSDAFTVRIWYKE